jgi:hypothetical protein
MGLYLKDKTKLIGTDGTRLLREYVFRKTPQAQSAEEASRTARGKRVPEVEINISIL